MFTFHPLQQNEEENIFSKLQDYNVSPLLIDIMEHFGREKGYDSVLEILKKYIQINQSFKQTKENEKDKDSKSISFSSVYSLVEWLFSVKLFFDFFFFFFAFFNFFFFFFFWLDQSFVSQ